MMREEQSKARYVHEGYFGLYTLASFAIYKVLLLSHTDRAPTRAPHFSVTRSAELLMNDGRPSCLRMSSLNEDQMLEAS